MSISNVNAMPQSCEDEIDVTWNNDGRAVFMAVDRVMVNAVHRPTNNVRTRIPIRGFRQPLRDTTVVSGNTYQYFVFNWDGNRRPINPPGLSNSALAGICLFLTSTAFIQKYPAIFELLVPRGAVINDYTHEEGSILKGLWKHVHQLKPPNNNAVIQAKAVNLVQSISGKLEAVSRETPPAGAGSDYLVAYEFDAAGDADWKGPINLVADDGPIDQVTGSTAIIQSTYDKQGKFELLVPRGAVIDHYIHEQGTFLAGQWTHVHTLKAPEDDVQITAVALTQTALGILLGVARISPPQGKGSDYLVAYEFDAAGDADWKGPINLVADDGPIDQVTGSTAIIQNKQGKFELLVPRGAVIDQYTHEDGTLLEGLWKHVHTLKSPENIQVRANWLIQSISGKFVAVARVSPPPGSGNDFLIGYELDPASDFGWQGPVKLVADDGPILIGGNP